MMVLLAARTVGNPVRVQSLNLVNYRFAFGSR